MVNLIVSIVVLRQAKERKCFSFIPAAVLIALYELACLFEASIVEHAWLLERILMILIVVSVLFLWRKGQLSVWGVFLAGGALLLRLGWGMVSDWFQEVMQYPGSDAVALLEQASTVRSAFDGLIFVLILVLQILMLHKLRKPGEI